MYLQGLLQVSILICFLDLSQLPHIPAIFRETYTESISVNPVISTWIALKTISDSISVFPSEIFPLIPPVFILADSSKSHTEVVQDNHILGIVDF